VSPDDTWLLSLSLEALSREIKGGIVSPVDATEACLRQIEARDGALNSFLTVCADSAREEARQLTEELAQDRYRGPLHGVPIALKDLYLTRGIRTTAGSRILRDWVPERDAAVVRYLRDAGAILLGKLNMHEFAFGATSENPHYGPARNPHDTSRITGGSSGGSAAAVQAGLCYGTLGSDTGGSIRCPAALCGIVGLKPTYGRVSRSGVLPLAWSLDHVGPMTRTVADAALMLEAIAGHDPDDPSSSQRRVPSYTRQLEGGVKGLRLGVPREFFWYPAEPAIRNQALATIQALEGAGAVVEEVSLPSMEYAADAQMTIIYAEAAAYHRPYMRTRYEEYGRSVGLRLAQGLFVNSGDYLDAQRARRLVRREFLDRLKTVDALVTPACPILAPEIGAQHLVVDDVVAPPQAFLVRNTFPFNLTGLPAISVPCGAARGLPIGLQIAGRPWEEATILRIARAVENLVIPT
jgi:aspartyl-tRNA(Asn)/glutamyl-tRNA(Gln) amidotransferase subunit A